MKSEICFDAQAAQEAKLAEENKSWVPNVVQDIYHSLMDKKPEFPAGLDQCGPTPAADITKGYELKRTQIITNPETDQLTLKMAGLPMDFHIKGPLRIDHMENANGKLVREPGEVKPGVARYSRQEDSIDVFTFQTPIGTRVSTTSSNAAWLVQDKLKP